MRRIRVWDLPTRLFHWALVLIVFLAWFTGDVLESSMELHQWLGIAMVGLIGFRLTWGLVGSRYARFSQFVAKPAQVKAYLKGDWKGVGHNPLGGWSVVVMLLLLTAMVLTGLFANNDADFTAPLAFMVTSDVSSFLTRVHHLVFKLLFVVIGLHILAVFAYKWILGKDLIQPMIDGHKLAESETDESATGGGWLALILALSVAALAMWGASAAWYTPPAKPAVQTTPDW